MLKTQKLFLIAIALGLLTSPAIFAGEKIKALIVDGQNNHAVWPKSTIMMKQYLEVTGKFEVSIARSAFLWKSGREKAYLPLAGTPAGEDKPQPVTDPNFAPNFSDYHVVISNFGWKAADWPKATQETFEKYISQGGAFVSVHAADNSWPKWKAYNQMIGLGGWGGTQRKRWALRLL